MTPKEVISLFTISYVACVLFWLAVYLIVILVEKIVKLIRRLLR